MNALYEIRQNFRLGDTPPQAFLPLTLLNDAEQAQPLFERLLSSTPADERAAHYSRWSQWYFALLLAPWSQLFLQHNHALPVALSQMGLRLTPEGIPMEFRLHNTGEAFADGGAATRLQALVDQQITPVCRTLHALSGLSQALLWNNAAVRLNQGMERAAAAGADIRAMQRLLNARHRPDGSRNALWQPVRRVSDATGKTRRERRLCCLRGEIAGERLCASCPLRRPKTLPAEKNAVASAQSPPLAARLQPV